MAEKNSDFMTLMMIFIGVIIAVVFMASIADSTNQDNVIVVNDSFVASTTANGSVAIPGRELIGTATIANGTDLIVLGNNFTVATGLGTDGLLSVLVTSLDGAIDEGFTNLNITYDYIPDGNVGAASRGVVALIIIFAALAIVVFTIVMIFKGMGKNLFNGSGFK